MSHFDARELSTTVKKGKLKKIAIKKPTKSRRKTRMDQKIEFSSSESSNLSQNEDLITTVNPNKVTANVKKTRKAREVKNNVKNDSIKVQNKNIGETRKGQKLEVMSSQNDDLGSNEDTTRTVTTKSTRNTGTTRKLRRDAVSSSRKVKSEKIDETKRNERLGFSYTESDNDCENEEKLSRIKNRKKAARQRKKANTVTKVRTSRTSVARNSVKVVTKKTMKYES